MRERGDDNPATGSKSKRKGSEMGRPPKDRGGMKGQNCAGGPVDEFPACSFPLLCAPPGMGTATNHPPTGEHKSALVRRNVLSPPESGAAFEAPRLRLRLDQPEGDTTVLETFSTLGPKL